MLLKCVCYNTCADAVYGKGVRPHVKLVRQRLWLSDHFICVLCGWVRTKSQGMKDGRKSVAP